MWNRRYRGRHSSERARAAGEFAEVHNDEQLEIVIDSTQIEIEDHIDFLDRALSA